MKLKNFGSATALLAAAALVLTGCTSDNTNGTVSETTGDKVTFVEGVGTSPPSLNPVVSTDVTVSSLAGAMFETLFRLTNTAEISPLLAKSWELSSDGLSLTLHLQEGVTWHDGEPFTSADVKYNLEEVLPLAPIGGSLAGHIASIETPDDLTVQVTLSEAFGPIFETLAGFKLLPAHLYEGTDIVTAEANLQPIGTGPFAFTEYVSGDRIVLDKYEDYWGTPASIDQLILKIIPDANARVLALQSGEIDKVVPIYLDQAQLGQLSGDEFLLAPQTAAGSTGTLSLNTRIAPLDNVDVRRAIYQAIDRDAIAKNAYNGNGAAARGPVPAEFDWAVADSDINFATDLPFDPEAAAKALDAAGFPVGADGTRFSMDLSTMSGFGTFALTAEAIKANLEAVDIAVNLTIEDFNVHVENVYQRHEFGASFVEFSPYNDPNLGVSRLYVCNPDNISYTNPSGMCDEEAQAGWDAAASSVDREVRAAGLYIAEKRAEELLYVLPLVTIQPKGAIRQDRWDGLDGYEAAWGGNTLDWTALKPKS